MANPQQMTKQEREAAARRAADEARLAAFINKGDPNANAEPAPAPVAAPVAPAALEPVTPPEAAAEPQEPAESPETAPEADTEAAEAVSEAQAPEAPAKAVSGARKGHSKAETPWAHAHPRVTVNFSTKFAEELHLQMVWLTKNVPQTSIQKIVQEATAQYVAKKIKEHFKP